MRAATSAPPPAGNATMSLMGCVGYCWATHGSAASARSSRATNRRMDTRRSESQDALGIVDQDRLQVARAEALLLQPRREALEEMIESHLLVEELRILGGGRAARIEEPAIVGDRHLTEVSAIGHLAHHVHHLAVE